MPGLSSQSHFVTMVFHKVSKEVVFFSFLFFSCLFSLAPTSLLLPSFLVVLFVWESIDLELLMFASQMLLMLGLQTWVTVQIFVVVHPLPRELCCLHLHTNLLQSWSFEFGVNWQLWDANLDILLFHIFILVAKIPMSIVNSS